MPGLDTRPGHPTLPDFPHLHLPKPILPGSPNYPALPPGGLGPGQTLPIIYPPALAKYLLDRLGFDLGGFGFGGRKHTCRVSSGRHC